MEQISAALDGNLCRCTGYRPILDSFSAFSQKCCPLAGSGKCCLDQEEEKRREEEEDLAPEPKRGDRRIAEESKRRTLVFNGKRTTWISPVALQELLGLKAKYPRAPLVVGNTSIGVDVRKLGIWYPVILHPARVPDLHVVYQVHNGLVIGAATHLAQLRDILLNVVPELPAEKTKIYRTLLKQLRTLAGEQIRNLASLGGHIVSRGSPWDLNPVLAAGKAILNLASTGRRRQIPLNGEFLARLPEADLSPEEVIVSVFIPFSNKDEFVSAFRQAERRKNALSVINSAMQVRFQPGTDVIEDLTILYGGIGCTTVSAPSTSQKLRGREWNEQMLDEACRLILEEIQLSPSAVGGKVEYRRTLLISFFFRFYLEVLQGLKCMYPSKYPDLPKENLSALGEFYDHPPRGMQEYQEVDPQQPPQDPVGRPIMNQSGIKHATGEAVYTNDIGPIDGQLYMAVVTSTRAHAKILSIDTSEALEAPGVVAVVTAADIPGENGDEYEEVLADTEVIYIGHIICGVIAETYELAKEATKKVKIEYQDLEPILTIQDAIQHNSYFDEEKKIEQGNVEEAFHTVDRIIEGENRVGGQNHFYLETNSSVVIPRKEDNEMDIYVSTQDASNVQEIVATALGVQYNRIRCHTTRVGGGFGGKCTKPSFFAAAAAVAAHKTGCPIRFTLERDDDMFICGGRHPFWGKYKVGFMNDGRIKAVDLEYYVNAGCTRDESVWEHVFSPVGVEAHLCSSPGLNDKPTAFQVADLTSVVIEWVVLNSCNVYDIVNFRCRGRACKTNLPSNNAFRGFGFPQTALSAEMWVSAVADTLGLPHDKVREMNMFKTVSLTPFKEEVDARNLVVCWKECLERSDYYNRRKAIEEFNKQNYWKKKGIAIIPMMFSIGYTTTHYHQAAALVNIYVDGSVLVLCGGCELGQGLYTKVLQKACRTLRKRLGPVIKENPEGKWEDWAKKAFEHSISLSATGYFTGYVTNMDWETGEGHAFPYFVFGVSCSEVEVDCLTGDHKSMGEAGLFLSASVFFAIKDAVAAARRQRGLNGVFTLDSPLNVARIRMACADHFTEMIPKDVPGTFKPWAIDIN
ncbi:UNVERIFIED_CONTAM: hypothetical protein K2H54_048715 [Gekko kuhli]